MKNTILLISILGILTGIAISDFAKLFSFLLIVGGLIAIISIFVWTTYKHGAIVCPVCHAKYSTRLKIAVKQQNRLFQCSRCGTMIHVDHRKR